MGCPKPERPRPETGLHTGDHWAEGKERGQWYRELSWARQWSQIKSTLFPLLEELYSTLDIVLWIIHMLTCTSFKANLHYNGPYYLCSMGVKRLVCDTEVTQDRELTFTHKQTAFTSALPTTSQCYLNNYTQIQYSQGRKLSNFPYKTITLWTDIKHFVL